MSNHSLFYWLWRPRRAAQSLLSRLLYPRLLGWKRGVLLQGRLRVNGLPLIDVERGAFIRIGDGVTLNSWNWHYHINLHSPVKLFADSVGAEIIIGSNTRIHGSCLHARRSIRVGANCLIAGNTQIFDWNGHELCFSDPEERLHTTDAPDPIVIEDNVWIGANSLILPGVRIGQGSVVAAGSVVTRSVPPLVVVGGNPARIIKETNDLLPKAPAAARMTARMPGC